MTKYVSFLRAVNVGNSGKISMAHLKNLYNDLGCSNVRTLLQSGNVIFDSEKLPNLKSAIKKRFNLSTEVIIRKQSEIKDLVDSDPFKQYKNISPSFLMVLFLADKVIGKDLKAIVTGPETIWCKEKEVYIVYPNGSGRSKLTLQKIESKLNTIGTMRNWNTVNKLSG